MSENPNSEISALLEENRTFPPSEAFTKGANVQSKATYEKAENNLESFWADEARLLDWIEPWSKVLDWKPPHAKWFVDGKLNVAANCVDRHALGERRDKVAILWEGEPGDRKSYTYHDVYIEVQKFANVLKSQGVKKGDRVAIYLPMIPEAAFAMLACARLGAIHSVVFGGFSSTSLRDRIDDASATVLITADGGYRRGGVVSLKANADKAVAETESITSVIVVARHGEPSDKIPCAMTEGRDFWLHDLMQTVEADCPAEPMDAEDVLYILYTSGTTGKPKGVVHTTGGYLTGVTSTARMVFDLKEDDVFWCTADIGWVTGHSYVVYGPMANGATCVMYEGAPDWPERDRNWEICERYGVTIFYTAPTAIRAFMKWGTEYLKGHDLSSLRLLGSVGEPINPEAWIWYNENIGGSRCPIVDTWWQTETGSIVVSPLPGLTATKPGSASFPLPGYSVKVLNSDGGIVEEGGGLLAITKPWPAMLRTIWGDDQRFVDTYYSQWKGRPDIYFSGDGAKVDANGYLWVLGRVDDVLNVSGHRIGTMELESALVQHNTVAEAAVVGKTHDVKGQAVSAFVTLRDGTVGTEELQAELKQFVADLIGAIARPDDIIFAADLPKTRSGKIMRRLLRDIAEGRALGDTTTLADPEVVAGLKEQYESIEN